MPFLRSAGKALSPAYAMMGGPKNSAADAGNSYLQQIAPMAQGNLNPYIEQGQQAGNTAYGRYDAMAKDPMAYLNDLFANYSMSEGFKNRKNQAMEAARDAAATGGFSGTWGDQKMQSELADSLASQDMQQWVQNVLGIQGSGLQGLQGLQNQGFGATTDLTNILGSTLGAQSDLAFQGQSQKNKNRSDMIQMLGKLGGGALGAMFGGPAGAAAGSQLGGSFANSIW